MGRGEGRVVLHDQIALARKKAPRDLGEKLISALKSFPDKAIFDFNLDRSGSVLNDPGTNSIQEELVTALGEAYQELDVSVYGFSGFQDKIDLFQYMESNYSSEPALHGFQETGGGGTPTLEAVEESFKRLQDKALRTQEKVMVIVTDGPPAEEGKVKAKLREIRDSGVRVITLVQKSTQASRIWPDERAVNELYGEGEWQPFVTSDDFLAGLEKLASGPAKPQIADLAANAPQKAAYSWASETPDLRRKVSPLDQDLRADPPSSITKVSQEDIRALPAGMKELPLPPAERVEVPAGLGEAVRSLTSGEDTEIQFVVDRSGSMLNDPQANSKQQAILEVFAEGVEQEGLKNTTITGFSRSMNQGLIEYELLKPGQSRKESVIHHLAHTGGGGTPTDAAIASAGARFQTDKEKVLVVMVDGPGLDTEADRRQVERARQEGVKVIGLFQLTYFNEMKESATKEAKYMHSVFGSNWAPVREAKDLPLALRQASKSS